MSDRHTRRIFAVVFGEMAKFPSTKMKEVAKRIRASEPYRRSDWTECDFDEETVKAMARLGMRCDRWEDED